MFEYIVCLKICEYIVFRYIRIYIVCIKICEYIGCIDILEYIV